MKYLHERKRKQELASKHDLSTLEGRRAYSRENYLTKIKTPYKEGFVTKDTYELVTGFKCDPFYNHSKYNKYYFKYGKYNGTHDKKEIR
jgi:hypothetical protein